MDKLEAIRQLEDFKEKFGFNRTLCREIYNAFKSNTGNEITCSNGLVVRYEPFWSYITTSDINNVFKRDNISHEDNAVLDESLQDSNTKLRKENLTINEKLKYERNCFNKRLKEISAIEELNKVLIENVKKLEPVKVNCAFNPKVTNDDVLVLSIGDWHLGEISYEFKDTGFDMEIASKRLKKYAEYVKQEIISKNINKVVIMCGGDIINNVTLLSKRLMQTSNRAVTTIMAVVLLQHLILDIYTVCRNITFAGVGNNESRYDEAYFEDEYLISNCADFVVYNMLELLFKNTNGIKFLSGRNCEKVVNINNQNILLSHGVAFGKGDVEKSVQQAISRYSIKGIDIRYVLLSHIHCTRNSNYFSRHGSLCGGNAYSNTSLNLQTRASQNVLTVGKNGDINCIGVDLENVDNIIGYDISNEIEKFDLRYRSKRPDLDKIQIA